MAPLTKYRISVEEYERMAQTGILRPDARVDLINGEIVEMAAIGSRHAACVDLITRTMIETLGRRVQVRVQNPVRVGEYSEPEPDVTILAPRSDHCATRHPGPENTLLVIEVAETTLDTDREIKAPLYASEKIPEIWVVNFPDQVVEVFRGLTLPTIHRRGDTIYLLANPDASIRVDDLLP
jgi:Uma2 family endonuclease